MQGNVRGQSGGGLDIQGIIQEYKVASGGNINAGDFVKFINNYNNPTITNNTQIQSDVISQDYVQAIKLNSTKVLTLFTMNATYKYLYGVICTINGNNINIGTYVQISTYMYSGQYYSGVALSENKVFIAHCDSNQYLSCTVCTIAGTTITISSHGNVTTSTRSGIEISTVKLSSSRVFIAHQMGASSTQVLYGVVCDIANNSVTVGTDTAISQSTYSGYTISTTTLNENKVFIAHSLTTTYYLYAAICTVSGTTITKDIDTAITYTNTGRRISAIALSEDKVFIEHSYYNNYYYLYGIVCIIDNNGITAGTDTELSSVQNSGYALKSVKLNSTTVLTTNAER